MNLSMNHLYATYAYNKSMDNADNGTAFAARPLKQWRKQYQSNSGFSRAATGMPMDRPGGLMSVPSVNIQCKTCNGALPANVEVFKDSQCSSCVSSTVFDWYYLKIEDLGFNACFRVINKLVTELYDLNDPLVNILGPATFPSPSNFYTADNSFDNGLFGPNGINFTSLYLKTKLNTLQPYFNIYYDSVNLLWNAESGSDVVYNGIKPVITTIPIPKLTTLTEKAYTDNSAYLQSRCATYDQKLSVERARRNSYFSAEGRPLEPSSSPSGSQVRETANCYSHKQPLVCNTTIYKPNNTPFAQQGGVSSSSRLSRLKYNTLNSNGAEYNSAVGAMGVNSGRYQTESSPGYYTKYKPQPVTSPHKNGRKSFCPNTICMSEVI